MHAAYDGGSDAEEGLLSVSVDPHFAAGHTTSPTVVFQARCSKFTKFFLFGITSWLLVTALFAQAAIAKEVLPEKDKIFSRIDLAMELGNILPALIFCLGFQRAVLSNLRAVIIVNLIVGIASAILYACFWKVTFAFGHASVSVVVLFCAWLAGTVGSMSMVTYFAFANRHGPIAISALATGVGACGLVTNILGVAQGLPELKHVADKSHALDVLRFSSSLYSLVTAAVIAVGTIAFCSIPRATVKNAATLESSSDNLEEVDNLPSSSFSAAFKMHRIELVAIFVTCFTEFAVPGLLPFLVPCKEPSATFWLTVAYLSGSLLGRMGTMVYMSKRLILMNVLQGALFVYALIVSHMQGASVHKEDGKEASSSCDPASVAILPFFITVAAMVTFSALHGHIVTAVFQLTGRDSSASSWAGFVNQAGACAGAIFSFILVQWGY
eukprot:g393.t1